MKKILTGTDARLKLKEGCNLMDRVVGTTYSPKGRNVTYQRPWGLPLVQHDGVSVAKEVESKDEYVQLGIELIREAATKQVSEVGDGTTLTTILANSIVEKGMALMDKGVNPMVLRKQIEKVVPILTDEIRKKSQPVKTKEQIRHVAYVSSNDDEIADAVTEAIEKVGADGLITPEEGLKQKIEVDYAVGLELDRGWGEVKFFVTNPERMEAIVENTSILVLGKKVTLISEIQPLLEVVIANRNKNIVIIGEMAGDALNMVVTNKIRGNIQALVVKPPEFGDTRQDLLDDIALITGAKVVIDEIGMPKDTFSRTFDPRWIGSAKMVIARKNTTNIIKYEVSDFKDAANKKTLVERDRLIKERIEALKKLRDSFESPYDIEKISERIARLSVGVALVKVGGKTDTDRREKLERVKDAIPAAQAAVSEGIVPGGAVILQQIAESINRGDLDDGEKLIHDSLLEPIKRLLKNAGESDESIAKILMEMKRKGGNFGYNCENGKVEDLVKTGVIDPSKVIRMAIEHAVAVASSILTCDAIIAIEREEKNNQMIMA